MSQATTDTDRIQQDIDATRARMDDRLTQLEGKLSPGQILDDVMKKLSGSEGGMFARDFMDSVRGAPLPAALTGIGLAWLMASSPKSASTETGHAGRTSSKANGSRWTDVGAFDRHLKDIEAGVSRAGDEDQSAYESRINDARGKHLGLARSSEDSHASFGERVQTAISTTRESLMRTAHDVADGASDLTAKATAAAQSAGGQIADAAEALPRMAKDMFAAVSGNPAVLGAVGLAIGALLGAIVPQTEAEKSTLKDAGDKLREAAGDVAQQAVDKGSELAANARDAAGNAADAAGLTPDKTVGEVAGALASGDLAQGLKQVASDVLKSVKDGVSAQPAQSADTDRQDPTSTQA